MSGKLWVYDTATGTIGQGNWVCPPTKNLEGGELVGGGGGGAGGPIECLPHKKITFPFWLARKPV